LEQVGFCNRRNWMIDDFLFAKVLKKWI